MEKRTLPWKPIVLAAVIISWIAWLTVGPIDFSDLYVYRGAGIRAWNHMTSYVPEKHYTFNYSPFSALFYALTFAQVPFETAAWGFMAFSMICWILMAGYWVQRQKLPLTESWVAWAMLAILFGVSLRDELKLSQVQILPLMASCIGLVLLEHAPRNQKDLRWEISAGMAVAFAIDIKVTFAIVLIPLLLKRHWIAVIFSGLFHFLLYNGLFLVLFHGVDHSWNENRAWFWMMNLTANQAQVDYYNMSSQSVLMKNGLPYPLAFLLNAGLDLSYSCSLFWKFRKKPLSYLFALAWAAIPLLYSISWPYWILEEIPLAAIILSILIKQIQRNRFQLRLHSNFALGGLILLCAGASTQDTEYLNSGLLSLGSLTFWWTSAWLIGNEIETDELQLQG